MDIKLIETKTEGLEDLPEREIFYFGPKMVSCGEQRIYKIEDVTFEVSIYDIRGNGAYYIRIFNRDNTNILGSLTIGARYHWWSESYLKIESDGSDLYYRHFEFKSKLPYRLDGILEKLYLLAVKMNRYKNQYPSRQYEYAYLIFLFYQDKKDKILVTEISDDVRAIRNIDDLITSAQTHNSNNSQYSKDTLFYKALNRYHTNQIERIKKLEIIF